MRKYFKKSILGSMLTLVTFTANAQNITISTGTTSNISSSTSGGIVTYSLTNESADGVLNVNDIQSVLNSGTDVTVDAAQNLEVNRNLTSLTWTSGNKLTLIADNGLLIDADINSSNGNGAVEFQGKVSIRVANLPNTAGNVTISTGSGNITFMSDWIAFDGGSTFAGNDTTTIRTTGTLSIIPFNDNFDSRTLGGSDGATGSNLDWNGTVNSSGHFVFVDDFRKLTIENYSSLGGLVLGKTATTNTVAVIGSDIGISGPISIYGGDIELAANITSIGNGNVLIHGRTSIAALTTNRTISNGSGDVTLISDNLARYNEDVIINSTGHFTFAPFSAAWSSYGGGFNFNGTLSDDDYTGSSDASGLSIQNVSGLTGLTLGKEDMTTGIISQIPLTVAGPITFYGESISIDENLTTTSGDVLMKATNNITQAFGKTITTNGGDVTFWADSDNNRAGGIRVGSDTDGDFTTAITTNGGDIILSGGANPSTGYAHYDAALGAAFSAYNYAVGVFGATLNASGTSDGGNIVVRGSAGNTFNGIIWTVNIGGQYGSNTKLVTNGNGTISIEGDGSEAPANATATNSRNSWGVVLPGTLETASGTISVVGKSNVSRTNARGFIVSGYIQSLSGAISLEDITNNTTSSNYTGPYINGVKIGKGTLNASSSDVYIAADKMAWDGSVEIETTGDVLIEPYADAFVGAYTFANVDVLGGANSLTIGKSTNNQSVTISKAQSIAGPITVYGGDISVNASLNTGSGGTAGDVLLKATNNITQVSGADITTSGGDVIYWSDSDDNGAGYIDILSDSISTSGGDIVLAGGAGTTVPTGYAYSNSQNLAGITLADGLSISSNGGNIFMKGYSSSSYTTGGVFPDGIRTYDNLTIDSGAGTISLIGESVNQAGIRFDGTTDPSIAIRSASTAPTAITIEGVSQNAYGLIFANHTSTSGSSKILIQSEAASGGDIIISGTSNASSGWRPGIFNRMDNGDLQILSNSGDITLYDTSATGFGLDDENGLYLGNRKDAVAVNGITPADTACSGNITIIGNSIGLYDPLYLETTGSFTFEPSGTSFSSDINYPITNLNVTSNGLTIGKSGNTSDINLNTDITTAGPVALYGGTLSINENISASTLNLEGNSATLAAGKQMNVTTDLTNNASLVLESDSNSFSSMKVGGSINGTGTMAYNRYVNSFPNNDLVSAPFTGGLTFGDIITDSESGSFETNPSNANMHLFGPYDTATDSYVTYTTTSHSNQAIVAGKGYRAGGNDTAGDDHATFKVESNGYAQHGVVVGIDLDNSGNGWNLVGNPYPTYLNMQTLLNGNSSVLYQGESWGIYGYNGAFTNDPSEWEVYNLNNASGVTIAPGQGFFVRTDASNQSFSFAPDMQTNTGGDDFIAGRSTTSESQHIKLRLGNGQLQAHTDIYLNTNGSNGLDIGYDSSLFQNAPAEFALYSHLVADNQGLPMAIQTLNTNALTNPSTTAIPLGVESVAGTQLTFGIDTSNLPVGAQVFLEDVQNNSFTDLTQQDYIVGISDALSGTGRFYIHLGQNSTLSTNDNAYQYLQVYAPKGSGTIVVSGLVESGMSLELYDLLGRNVMNQELEASNGRQAFAVGHLADGTYVVRLQGNKGSRAVKVVLSK